jgi:hypothetical protein
MGTESKAKGQTLSDYTTGQTWGALRRSWKGYKIAKGKNNKVDMILYAQRIRTLQKELGLPESSFPEIAIGDAGQKT